MSTKKTDEFIHVKLCFVLFTFLCTAVLAACIFAGAKLPDTIARPLTDREQAEIVSRNSGLVDYVYLSPNADFPRTDEIRKITVHHMAADLKLDNLGYAFAERDRNASANYAIDTDGNVALYVEECNRAWTSGNPGNDQQAVTIEVANDETGGDWHVSDAAFDALVDLCADICRRNGIEELEWTGDADGNLTVHSMFSEKTACPGPYLLGSMPELAKLVNEELRQDVESAPEASASGNQPEARAIDTSKPMVALTFDDGPDGIWTDAILDVLEENGALATFFVIGENVEEYPETVKRIADMGCEIGNHGYDDGHLTDLDIDGLRENLEATDNAVTDAGAPLPGLLRAPGGAMSQTVRRNAGKAVIGWTVDTLDWKTRDARATIDCVKGHGDLDGAVILVHSLYESSADAVAELVPWLQEQGYQLVTVSELMAYYYGELPQSGNYYSNRYFSTHGRTDEPVLITKEG